MDGQIEISGPRVRAIALTIPDHGQRKVMIAKEDRSVVLTGEARSLNIQNETRVAVVSPE